MSHQASFLANGAPKAKAGEWLGHPGGTNAAAFMPPHFDRFVSVGNDSKVKMWSVSRVGTMLDVVERRRLVPPLGHAAAVLHVAASADGADFATASADKAALVHDAARVAPRIRLPHAKPVRWLSFPAPEELQRSLLTLSGANILTKWDLRTAGAVARFEGLSSRVTSVAFAKSGVEFLVACEKKPILGLFNWDSTRALDVFPTEDLGTIGSLATAGKTIMGLTEQSKLLQISVDSGKVSVSAGKAFESAKDLCGNLTASPDGRLLCCGERRGSVLFWERASGKLKATIPSGFKSPTGPVWNPGKRNSALIFGPKTDKIHLWE